MLNTRGQLRDSFTFIGISDQGVPVGMRHGAICLPDYARPEELFGLTLSKHGDESAAPRGKRALTAWFPFLASERDRPGKLIAPIREIMPFLDLFTDAIHAQRPDAMQYATPPTLSGREGTSLVRLERGAAKNLFFIRDDGRYPVQAVAAAKKMAGLLR